MTLGPGQSGHTGRGPSRKLAERSAAACGAEAPGASRRMPTHCPRGWGAPMGFQAVAGATLVSFVLGMLLATAHCHLPPAGARGARDTTSFVPRPVARGDSPASGLVWRGTPSAHPRFPLRVPQDGAPRPCTPPVPEADGALSPASARPRVVTQAGQAGLAPWGARLGPLGTRPSRWSCPRCPAPGAHWGAV